MLVSYILKLSLVLFGFVILPKNEKPLTNHWVICANSSLVVNGSTNFSKFSCSINSYANIDTVNIGLDKVSKKIMLKGVMNIAISGFDCNNNIMTKELRKTLKQEEFPEMQVYFLSLNSTPNMSQNSTSLKGSVAIQIAGVRKKFDIYYTISIAENGILYLTANKDINFSDFNLIPPRKMGRLVQAKDRLNVVLDLKMKAI